MSNLNPLILENWTVTKVDQSPGLTVISAEYDLAPEACPKCGSVTKFEKKARAVQTFMDTPAWGGRVEIHVRRVRYQCPECRGTFMQPLPDMALGYELTERCAIYVADQGIQGVYAAVGRTVGVGEKTVRKLANAYGTKALEARGITAPVVLGIDELGLLGPRRSIFTNVGEREVIDLVPDMDQKTIRRWLWALPNRDRVQIVTIDMWDAYRRAAYDTLPNAAVIVDRWHIQKKGTEALDKVRNRLAKAAKSKKARTEALRGRRLLMARHKRLRAKAALLLDGWLANTPILKAAYWAKEGFFDVWEATDRTEALARYEAWRNSFDPLLVPEFLATIATVTEWETEIFRYFDDRFTNAYTEAANGLIKKANRAGNGYSFEGIRMKALLRKTIYPLELLVCESCLAQLHNSQRAKFSTFTDAPDGVARKDVDFCSACYSRPTLEAWLSHRL